MRGPVYIGCDDSGFEAKQYIVAYFIEKGIPYVDCGSDDAPSRYPYYAAKVASAVSCGAADKGILICGSGIGMSIAANKFKGVRAALVSDSYGAYLTRRHNDSNVLCLGGRTSGRWMILEIVDTWLHTDYDGGHHDKSLELITELEKCNFTGECWCPGDKPYPDFDWNPAQKL